MDEKSVEILAAVFLTNIMGVLVCRILSFETETNANFYLSGVVVGIAAAFLLKKKWNRLFCENICNRCVFNDDYKGKKKIV